MKLKHYYLISTLASFLVAGVLFQVGLGAIGLAMAVCGAVLIGVTIHTHEHDE